MAPSVPQKKRSHTRRHLFSMTYGNFWRRLWRRLRRPACLATIPVLADNHGHVAQKHNRLRHCSNSCTGVAWRAGEHSVWFPGAQGPRETSGMRACSSFSGTRFACCSRGFRRSRRTARGGSRCLLCHGPLCRLQRRSGSSVSRQARCVARLTRHGLQVCDLQDTPFALPEARRLGPLTLLMAVCAKSLPSCGVPLNANTNPRCCV